MEPLDPAKNAEGSGFSKRRISSILKAPRKSTICRDPEQQENKVENTRPLEKRNSRRVSFAPANDVLLFAKDAKNASPARSPLQELMAAAAATTQNRLQEPEDGNQQIKGIENLLNAPLHASQQRDVVNFDTGNDFGEKTVTFSMEDAVMDMTHSHTINIANDAELLGDISMQNYDILAGEDRKVTVDQSTDVSLSHIVNMKSGSVPVPTGRGSDLSVEKRNLSSKLPCLDPGFENFLASLSKPSTDTVTTRMIPFAEPSSDETSSSLFQNKTQRADVDKENQVPKSHNSSRKVGESFERHAFCPEGDVDMDISEAQTGRILGVGDDPFQCLFPIEAMCAHTDKITSQMTEIQQQQSSKMLGSSDLKEKKSFINPLLHAPHQRPIVISDPKDKCREKTIIFNADDECLDMTQSHTVNIASSSLAPVQSSANTLDAGFNNFLASLSRPSDPSRNPDTHRRKPITSPTSKTTNDANSSLSQHKTPRPRAGKENCLSNTSGSIRKPFSGGITGTKDDTSLDLTETQTGRVPGLTGSDDPFQFLIPSEDVYPLSESRKQADVTSRQQSSGFRFPNQTGMETSIKPSVKLQLQRQQEKPEIEDDHQEKTVRFSAEDACMDVTQSQTVNIFTDLKLQLYHNVDLAPSCGEKTVRFTVDDAPMDMTQCLTVNIDSNLVSDSVPSVRKQEIKTCGPPQHGSSSTHHSDSRFSNPLTNTSKPSDYSVQSYDGFAICPKDDVSIDMTEVHIAEVLGTDDPLQCLLTTKGMRPHSVNLKKTEMTSQQQSNEAIGTSKYKAMETSVQTSLKTKLQRQVTFDAEDEGKEKTVRFTFDDACMDMTRSHTLNIVSHLPQQPYQTVDRSAYEEKTMRFTADDATMDVTRSHTVNIATDLNMLQHQNMDLLLANRKKTMKLPAGDTSMDVTRRHTSNIVSRLPQQSYQSVDRPAYEEKTVRFTADDATMDVTRSHTVNIATDLNMLQHQNVDLIPANSEKTVRFTADDASMDVTRSHTVNIATDLNMLQHQNVDLLLANRKKTTRLPADDTSMDVTKRHTLNIVSRLPQQSYQTVDRPAYEEKTVRFTADDATMDVTRSHTVNIATDLNMLQHQNVDLIPANSEKTVRFTAGDATMDVTRSHTVNIATDLNMLQHQNVDLLLANRKKTMRLPADDTSMDVTRRHTLNIVSHLPQQSYQSVDRPAYEEKTVRFTADDATMDVTRSHTVNIATDINAPSEENLNFISANREKMAKKDAMDVTRSPTVNASTDLNLQSYQNVLPLSTNGEKNRYSANDETMDVTRSHTVNIAAKFDPKLSQNVALLPNNPEKPVRLTASNTSVNMSQSQTVNMTTDVESKLYQNMDFVPTCGERTTSTTNDATMDMTRSLTVNIASNSASGLVLTSEKFPLNCENLNFPVGVKKSDNETCVPHSNRPSLAYGVNQEFDNSLYKTTSEAADTLFPQETDSNVVLVPLKTQKPDMSTENEAPSLVLPVMEKTVNKTTDCPEISVNMDMTKGQTCSILEQTCTDDTSQSLSSTQGPTSDLLLKTELTSQNNGALGSPISDDVEIKNPPDSLDSNETETIEENEPTPTAYQSQKMGSSPSTVDQDGDASSSRKSRRMSLANLQSKVRRLSHIINTAPDAMAIDSCTAPLPQLNQDLNKNSNDETTSLPEVEPELEMVNLQDNTQAFGLKQAEQLCATSTATPFNLKTKTLISRLSVGGFKPKLPQRDNTERTKKMASGEPTKTVTVNITSQLNNSDNVSDIYDEELGSYEDISETLETRSPDKNFEKEGLFYEFNMFEPLEENVFEEESVRTVHGQKRPLPEDEDNKEDEKRLKASTKFTELTPQSDAVEFDRDIASTRTTTHTIDFSSTSHTASRCEAACESTIKNSLFESQIEDYDSDAQNKLEDGTITVLEFFKLFNIDFVIHNPRQSIVAGKLQSDTDTKPLDLLKGRHISLPKQLVYKMDIKTLTEKVEGLKVRMRDLDKPLKTVNRHLWEEMRRSSEKEMKSFGAKLKEQNNFFRKTSKIQSHEMKEVLYSTLVRANQEEQQKLRGTIEEADGMIKSLDECICELEAELAAVEENGSEEKPSLASLQEETNNVTEALADKSRQISELEMQKTQNLSKLNRLKAETRNLESHINMLNMVNEWKLREKRENCTVYAFLHETMLLQLVFEKADDTGSEQKVTDIAFKLELDDEKSDFYAHLVHNLVSKFIERESAWVEKYPTQRHVPKLLRDVSLVVSRCRLLGEELRLLKMWGGLRLNILDISCMDTRLHIVFSSLKKCSKFEVVFATSLIDQLCVLHVESFKNMIGSTTMQQIEEIVASFTPGKNLLTKIVRKIHNTLLS